MGKYSFEDCGKGKSELNPSIKYWHIQLMIANELAEANRLKRLEIKFTYPDKSLRELITKELEDQA